MLLIKTICFSPRFFWGWGLQANVCTPRSLLITCVIFWQQRPKSPVNRTRGTGVRYLLSAPIRCAKRKPSPGENGGDDIAGR